MAQVIRSLRSACTEDLVTMHHILKGDLWASDEAKFSYEYVPWRPYLSTTILISTSMVTTYIPPVSNRLWIRRK
jgi:hypothetical protein